MKRYLIITLALAVGTVALHAQDTTKVCSFEARDGLFRFTCECGCHNHPHNYYSGLNSLRARLADPTWDGKGLPLPNIGTGLRFEDGKIRPLTASDGTADAVAPETSVENSVQGGSIVKDPYWEGVWKGELPVGAPVFIFFRFGGSYVTDAPQILNVNAAADLAITRNLRVRITGAADSATGSAEKNAALAKARAEHVASLMEKRGVQKDRIEVLSEGGTAVWEPVSANRNCRIELFHR